MIFRETPLAGVVILEPEPQEDERGFFARTWCAREFAAHGLNPRLVQCSISFNKRKGTLRGMHYQAPPAQEAKLVRCTAGAMYDVVIDLRPRSPTRLRHLAVTLSAANHRMLYVPEGFAHGFQTLEDGTEVEYHMTEFHWPECARGVRWNDPAFGIQWPDPHPIILARDRDYPDMLLPGEVKGP